MMTGSPGAVDQGLCRNCSEVSNIIGMFGYRMKLPALSRSVSVGAYDVEVIIDEPSHNHR